MPVSAVFFDLDGTLLPMDQDLFVKTYFGCLAKKLSIRGYEPKALIDAVWAGTRAMVKNDGSKVNAEAFWDCFCGIYGPEARQDEPLFEEFYRCEFQQARAVCGLNPKAAEIIAPLKARGLRCVLATNPLFPAIATHSRIRWAGLEPEDFCCISTYENSRFCKPNPDYYRELLDRLGLRGEDCLMVGNDAVEDTAAAEAGMRVFLVTDCLLNPGGKDISAWPHGDFDALRAWLEAALEA